MKKSQIIVATLAILLAVSPSVWANAPQFAGGANNLRSDLITILTPIFGIAIIAVGVACWFGKISWNWFIGIVIGAILVFGNQQMVTWIRSAFMV